MKQEYNLWSIVDMENELITYLETDQYNDELKMVSNLFKTRNGARANRFFGDKVVRVKVTIEVV